MSKLKTTQLKRYTMTEKQTDRRLNTTKENQYFSFHTHTCSCHHTTPHTHTHPPSALGGPAAADGARREELPGRRALDDSARDGRQHVLRLRSVFVSVRGRPRCWAARRRGCRAGRPQQKSHRGAGRGRSGRSARPPEGAAQEGKIKLEYYR